MHAVLTDQIADILHINDNNNNTIEVSNCTELYIGPYQKSKTFLKKAPSNILNRVLNNTLTCKGCFFFRK